MAAADEHQTKVVLIYALTTSIVSITLLASVKISRRSHVKRYSNAVSFTPQANLLVEKLKSQPFGKIIVVDPQLSVGCDYIGIFGNGANIILLTNIPASKLKFSILQLDDGLANTVLITGFATLVQLIPAGVFYKTRHLTGITDGLLSNAFITSTIATLLVIFLLIWVLVTSIERYDKFVGKCSGLITANDVVLGVRVDDAILMCRSSDGSTNQHSRAMLRYEENIRRGPDAFKWLMLQFTGIMGAINCTRNLDSIYDSDGKAWMSNLTKRLVHAMVEIGEDASHRREQNMRTCGTMELLIQKVLPRYVLSEWDGTLPAYLSFEERKEIVCAMISVSKLIVNTLQHGANNVYDKMLIRYTDWSDSADAVYNDVTAKLRREDDWVARVQRIKYILVETQDPMYIKEAGRMAEWKRLRLKYIAPSGAVNVEDRAQGQRSGPTEQTV